MMYVYIVNFYVYFYENEIRSHAGRRVMTYERKPYNQFALADRIRRYLNILYYRLGRMAARVRYTKL